MGLAKQKPCEIGVIKMPYAASDGIALHSSVSELWRKRNGNSMQKKLWLTSMLLLQLSNSPFLFTRVWVLLDTLKTSWLKKDQKQNKFQRFVYKEIERIDTLRSGKGAQC